MNKEFTVVKASWDWITREAKPGFNQSIITIDFEDCDLKSKDLITNDLRNGITLFTLNDFPPYNFIIDSKENRAWVPEQLLEKGAKWFKY